MQTLNAITQKPKNEHFQNLKSICRLVEVVETNIDTKLVERKLSNSISCIGLCSVKWGGVIDEVGVILRWCQ